MERFLTDNSATMRLARTIVQGVIGVLITFIGDLVNIWTASPVVGGFITALVIAILSPIMAAISKAGADNTDILGSEYKGEEK